MKTMIIKYTLSAIFALSVVGKVTGKTKSTFEKAGYRANIMYATAIAEVILTIGLFTSFDLFAIIGLLAVIGGAIFTLFRQKAKPMNYLLAVITAILLLTLLGFKILK